MRGETKEEVIARLKEAIKSGGPLNDSAFWYLNDKGVEGLFEVEQTEEYKRVVLASITHDMLEIAKYIATEHADKKKVVFTDWGCGNGEISKIVTQDLIKRGFEVIYMPIDISEKALLTAKEEHAAEEVKPLLCLFEDLKNHFPLKVLDDTVVVHGFLGSTVGNFERDKVNELIKSVGEEVIVHMSLVGEIRDKELEKKVIAGYQNKAIEKLVLGVFEICGFSEKDFVLEDSELRYKARFEDDMVKTSVTLARDKEFEGVTLAAGTIYDITESRKFDLNGFKNFIAPSCGDSARMISNGSAMAVCKAPEQTLGAEEQTF